MLLNRRDIHTSPLDLRWWQEVSHIAQNIAEKFQEYFLYFIVIEILL